jgi:two-component system, NtrC family, sensor histidine kinase HydH
MLFYLPLILGAFWFGMRGSLYVCVGVIALYVPYVAEKWDGLSVDEFNKLMEGLLFVVIAVILGLLVEKERKKKQALVEAESLAAVGKAVTEIAHDMKTPLMAIGGFVRQALRGMPEKDGSRKKLEIVVEETCRLENMVKSMLDFGRPVELQISRLNLNEVAQEIVELVRANAEKCGVILHEDLDQDKDPVVFADRNKVKRVFLNLVNNAIQASPCGKKVSLRTFAEKGSAVFQVTDRGSGIEPQHLESVFHPFFTTKKSGTGLGLGIAKKIVEAQGGKIFFTLNRDEGVTFTVTLSSKALNRPYQ